MSEPVAPPPPEYPLSGLPPPSGAKVALVLIAIVAGCCVSCVALTLLYGWFLDVHGGR